jgi:lysocardiolipin and lysophospholipid acyltransferase
MHWRRFAVSSLPLNDEKAFDAWLHERWVEKDALLEYYTQHGHFPSSIGGTNGSTAPSGEKRAKGEIICARAGPNSPFEFLQIFVSLLAVPVAWKMFKFILGVVQFLTR